MRSLVVIVGTMHCWVYILPLYEPIEEADTRLMKDGGWCHGLIGPGKREREQFACRLKTNRHPAAPAAQMSRCLRGNRRQLPVTPFKTSSVSFFRSGCIPISRSSWVAVACCCDGAEQWGNQNRASQGTPLRKSRHSWSGRDLHRWICFLHTPTDCIITNLFAAQEEFLQRNVRLNTSHEVFLHSRRIDSMSVVDTEHVRLGGQRGVGTVGLEIRMSGTRWTQCYLRDRPLT
ncbi:hypothetical protein VTK56DRAFT_4923 [Thermocarpiscus australiensis]